MRRKEKEITDTREMEAILRRAAVCHLAMVDDGEPYVVPMNFGYEGGALYFHSAPAGRKIGILRKNPTVSFSIVGEAEVAPAESACGWSTRYRSVTGCGKAVIVDDVEGKREGLSVLMSQYSEREYDLSGADLDGMVVIRVDIEEMKGKESG